MADKLRKTFPLRITFGSGEQPTSPKLTAMADQARNGSDILESAIGDIWNNGGDAVLSDYPLQIPNLGRLIGENRLLNPFIYQPSSNDVYYQDFVGDKFTGLSEAKLQWYPDVLQTAGGQLNVSNVKFSRGDVVDADDWYIDADTNTLYFMGSFASGDYITYTVSSGSFSQTTAFLPSVIPDPRQTDFTGCRISESGGTKYIHLPPRQPIPFSANDIPDRYPPTVDTSDAYNKATVIGSPHKIFQDPTSNALAEDHYRYRLPKEILDALLGLNVGDALPPGFLILWNKNTNTIVYDAIFRKAGTDNWVFEIESVSADTLLDADISADETEVSYNTDWVVVTVGASVARHINHLTDVVSRSENNAINDFRAITSHNYLKDQNPSTTSMGLSTGFGPSYWINDEHIHLLSRAPNGASRDANDNAMLGDLIMGSTSDTAGDGIYLRSDVDSRKIYFGNNTNSNIHANSSSDILFNMSGSGKVVIGESGLMPTPAEELHLASSFSPTMLIEAITPNDDSALRLKNSTQGWKCFLNGADSDKFHIRDEDASLNRLTIDTSGNVGIGTTSPGSLLDVNGNLTAANIESTTGLIGTDTGVDLVLRAGGGAGLTIDDSTKHISMCSAAAPDGTIPVFVYKSTGISALRLQTNAASSSTYLSLKSGLTGSPYEWQVLNNGSASNQFEIYSATDTLTALTVSKTGNTIVPGDHTTTKYTSSAIPSVYTLGNNSNVSLGVTASSGTVVKTSLVNTILANTLQINDTLIFNVIFDLDVDVAASQTSVIGIKLGGSADTDDGQQFPMTTISADSIGHMNATIIYKGTSSWTGSVYFDADSTAGLAVRTNKTLAVTSDIPVYIYHKHVSAGSATSVATLHYSATIVPA